MYIRLSSTKPTSHNLLRVYFKILLRSFKKHCTLQPAHGGLVNMLALRISTMTNAFCSTYIVKCCPNSAEHLSSKSVYVDECTQQGIS